MSSRLLLLSARCAVALASLLPSVVAASAAEPWTVGDYQVVSSVRVGRTDVEFEIRASITNGGASATGVTAKVTSTVASTVVLEDSLSFGDVAAGVKQPAQDTFKIRQNRTSSFDASRLVWEVTVAPVESLKVTITAPVDGFLANTPVVHVTGNTSAAVASVKVNAVTASLSGTSFAADVPVIEGGNTLTAVATDSAGTVASASVNVTRDTQSPRVAIDSPASGSLVGTNQITVTGIINDTVIGTVNSSQASVQVNGITATVANRTFSAANVPLSPGANTLIANAVDRAGNVGTASVSVTFLDTATPKVQIVSGDNQTARIGTLLPTPLGVLVTDAQGAPMAGEEVIFKVIQNDGLLTGGGRTARSVIIPTDSNGQAQVAFQIGTRVGVGNHQVEAMVVGISIDALFRASATPAPPALLVADAGNRQSGVPGQPLARPLVAIVVDSGNNRLAGVPITFTATEGGGGFAGSAVKTVLTDADGRALATLTLGAEEGIENNRVEATFSGNTQLPVAFVASGMTPGPAAETSISGVILDNSDVPVPGATLTINGTALSAQSDAQGQFIIKPAPVGTVRLDVDGSTVTRAGSWVNLDFTLTTVSGKDNTIGMPIRLLPMDLTHAVAVGTNYGGTITLPDFPGFSLKLLPDSVTFPGGSHVGSVHATVVHNDKTPEVPNFGQQPRFIVSINPKRAAFNPPAQMCLPNLDGLPPGQKTEMYSFDEDLDSFVSIGTGTVSLDGMQICSDSGFGVIKGGWHCGGNPAPPGSTATATVEITTAGPIVKCFTLTPKVTVQITATGDPAPPGSPPFTWTSSDEAIAKITAGKNDATVTVEAQKEGKATLSVVYRCKSGQPSAPKSIDVSFVKIDSVAVDSSDTDTHKIPSAMANGKDHFVCIKGTGDIVLKATVTPSTQEVKDKITWEASGATITSPAVGTDRLTAKLSSADSKKIPVTIKVDGMVCWEGFVWVVWASPTSSTSGTSVLFGTTLGSVSGRVGTAYRAEARIEWTATIAPVEIITDADRPAIDTQTRAAPPGGAEFNSGVPTGADFKGWDFSRRIRDRWLYGNPAKTPPEVLTMTQAGDPVDTAFMTPTDFPADTVLGNDDRGSGDEDDNPYDATAGTMRSFDGPGFPRSDGRDYFARVPGEEGDTLRTRQRFGEFVRVQLGSTWYRCSDFGVWRFDWAMKIQTAQWNAEPGQPEAFDLTDPAPLDF